ncbi:hypothetical protein SAMN05428958_11313 [Pantoea sesami]|nr:hypothetical protein SAMN05428958_11313 [Pantoea sesami]
MVNSSVFCVSANWPLFKSQITNITRITDSMINLQVRITVTPHDAVCSRPDRFVSAAQLPVAIDYPAALALRQMALVHDELPKYLLVPEVSALLHYVPDLHRKMLLATL